MFYFLRQIKYGYQRFRRGWSDEDAWDICGYLAEIMPPMLRRLKGGVGCPSRFYDKEAVGNECHRWNEAVEEMAQGFEAAKYLMRGYWTWKKDEKTGNYKQEIDDKAINNAVDKMKKNLQLFVDNFSNLWD